MMLETVFSIANSAALLAWLALILLPRWAVLLVGIRYGLIGALSLGYAAFAAVYFAGAPGGFGSLAQVQMLFTVPEMVLIGWLHYLAFDLFVGVWIAERSDALGIHRTLQAPILILTFMLGPVGLLLFFAVRASFGLSHVTLKQGDAS